MEQLAGEMLESGEYTRQIEQFLDRCYAERWVPNCQLPKTTVFQINLFKRSYSIILQVWWQARSEVWWTREIEWAGTRIEWGSCQTEEEFKSEIRSLLPQLVERICKRAEKRLPSDMEETLCYDVLLDRNQPPQIAKEMESHPGLLAMIGERRPTVQAAYDAQLVQAPCPEGFRPIHIASLELRCDVHDDRWENVLLIHLFNGLYSEEKTPFDPGYIPYYQDTEKRLEALYLQARNGVDTLLRRAAKTPPLYAASSIRDLPGMTDALDTLLRRGSVSLGHVTVQWDGPQYTGGCLLYQPRQDDGKVRFILDEGKITDCPIVPLAPDLLQQPLELSGETRELPRDLMGLYRLGEALQEQLEKTFRGTGLALPKVRVQADKAFRLTVLWSIRKVPLVSFDKTVEMALQEIAEQIYQEETFRPAERQVQLNVLNTLNPTELAILRYLYGNGNRSFQDLMHAIGDQLYTLRHYTRMGLIHLSQLEVPVYKKMVPLLQIDGCRQEDDDFLYYWGSFKTLAQIEPEVLRAAIGRPFTPADVDKMRPPARTQWFNQYLLEADEEQRWTRFNEALAFMAPTYLAKFVSTEAGQAFLRNFTGSQAVLARQKVETLPGCKRLAAKLWPEEDEKIDGEA